jgi:hypothetical protein
MNINLDIIFIVRSCTLLYKQSNPFVIDGFMDLTWYDIYIYIYIEAILTIVSIWRRTVTVLCEIGRNKGKRVIIQFN